jgi:translation initiation factor 4A
MPPYILELTQQFLRDPVRILVKKENLTLEGIRQFFLPIEKED